jgi:hypothetical protein
MGLLKFSSWLQGDLVREFANNENKIACGEFCRIYIYIFATKHRSFHSSRNRSATSIGRIHRSCRFPSNQLPHKLGCVEAHNYTFKASTSSLS